ncbi:MAG TPA: ATP-binding protein [Actinophytocola sp.]|uniref:PAS domain-containing sensor histidine kinase n=1 Tax=Actinophytocola sp. TaxID=1872138 RepID=UPI002DBA6E45|nr:ATP-binding protein [Actinophytocola sp.]HEU5474194.1 ATP-binding protein [Actinophytocola sp.]
MSEPNRSTVRADAAAVQVVDLVVKAAELLSGPNQTDDPLDELAAVLRATQGIHAVSRRPRTVASIWDASRDLPGQRTPTATQVSSWAGQRQRHLIGASSRGVGPDLLVVDLARPGDDDWVGPGQLHRLTSALTVIESATSAGGRPADGPSEWLLRHGRSIVVQLMPESWVVRSDAMTRVLGYPRSFVPVQAPLSLVDPRDRTAALRAYVEVLTGRRTDHTVDLRVRAADGGSRVLETTFVNLLSAPGVHSVVLYGEDVTEQRAERARTRELVNGALSALLVVDERGRIRLVNDHFTRLFGTRAGGWIGAHQEDALRAVAAICLDEPGVARRLRPYTTANKRRATQLDLADGRVVELSRAPLEDGGASLGSLWAFLDVSLDISRRQDQPDEAVQNRILATVSHELRTPLTAVLSFAELLGDPHMGPLNEGQQSACDVIARNTKRLLTLVDDLLLLARLESGQHPLRARALDLAQLVTDTVAQHQIEAEEAGITLLCVALPGPDLSGDPNRLQQVIDNLVGNAIKFSPASSTVQVRAGHHGDRWTIEVADSGIGIPEGELTSITRGFKRGSNALSAGIPGSGIGLAVCRELVELHGGTLDIRSVVDVGTTVRITLPDQGSAP